MTVAWIATRMEERISKTLRASPWKIKVFDPAEFTLANVLMSGEDDVIVADVTDHDLLNLCHQLCRQQIAPVLAIVMDLAYAQATLEVGADDFVVAPINPMEVLLRLHKLIRNTNIIRVGGLKIDLATCRVSAQNCRIALSKIQFRLLASLARRVGQLVTQTTILEEMRILESEHITKAQLEGHIGRLQKKIEPNFQHPQYIISIPGVGYRLRNHKQWESIQHEAPGLDVIFRVPS